MSNTLKEGIENWIWEFVENGWTTESEIKDELMANIMPLIYLETTKLYKEGYDDGLIEAIERIDELRYNKE